MKSLLVKHDNTMAKSKTTHFHSSKIMMTMMGDENDDNFVSMSTSSLKGMPIQIQANGPLGCFSELLLEELMLTDRRSWESLDRHPPTWPGR